MKLQHNAIREVFPEAQINGCFFHYCQALWRKAAKIGLTDWLTDGWLYLLHDSPSGVAADAFKQYMSSQWINSVNSELVTCYGEKFRTTNHVEGWHSRINRKFSKNPSLNLVLEILHDESQNVDFQIERLNNHVDEVSRKRRRTDSKDVVIQKILEDLTSEKIDIEECLQRLTRVKFITNLKQ
ncbi:unnamed protein product [Plutella xylostella]|uniref:(diamondback moth) hypothetical protein n=1 Tax=Plutella xylostella TaxID=51655 RepID=A0A8S4FQD0_PLUXY|nr:unnamed protein product [Plutella xylostella]